MRVTINDGGNALAHCRDFRSVSNHRRATSPRLSARSGLAFATAAVLAGGVFGGVTLVAQPTATATAAPLIATDARLAAPARPAAAPAKAPVKPSSAPATQRKRTKAPTTTTTKPKARSKAKATEAAFCDKNPDRCTGGLPDKKSDRAEYQNDPRSNAEINSDMPLYAPEGLCPDGYARIAGVC